MPLTKTQKQKLIDELTDSLMKSNSIAFTTFNKLNTQRLNTLRAELRNNNAFFKVFKKTLLNLALKKSGKENIDLEIFKDNIGIVCNFGEELATLKMIDKFIKSNKELSFVGGFSGGNFLSKEVITAMSKLPGREQLIANLVMLIASPIRSFGLTLNAIASKK